MSDILESLAGFRGKHLERPRGIRIMRRTLRDLDLKVAGARRGGSEGSVHWEYQAKGSSKRRISDKSFRPGWGRIYKLRNVVTGKEYVGQTVKNQLAQRMSAHKHACRGRGCRILNNSIRKHGWDSFVVEVIGEAPVGKNLDDLEAALIERHNTVQPNGYNILDHASTSPFSDPEVRAKRAATMEKPEVRARLSASIKRARKDRPDWKAACVAARQARAERERAAKVATMTPKQAARYLRERAREKEKKDAERAARFEAA
jgi:group I intron endonuclease